MGQDVKDGSRVCPLPPGPLKDLSQHFRPRTIFVAVSLTLILTTIGLVYWILPKPLPIILIEDTVIRIPHAAISIDGDTNFSDTALLEGWPGDGSPENPFIINGLDIDLGDGEGHCISISKTRVSFIISGCSLSGARWEDWPGGAGIYLRNVTHGKLVNNILDGNLFGISVGNVNYSTMTDNICTNNSNGIECFWSSHNTVVNNTCLNNRIGIRIHAWSTSNTLADNTCYNNSYGIYFSDSDSNTVVNNTCISSVCHGIDLCGSHFNTVANNTCSRNKQYGIKLFKSDSNTVANNTCSCNDMIGIYLEESNSDIVVNNTCTSNDIGISLKGSDLNTVENNIFNNNRIDIESPFFDPVFDNMFLLLMGFAGITLLGAGWRMAKAYQTWREAGEGSRKATYEEWPVLTSSKGDKGKG